MVIDGKTFGHTTELSLTLRGSKLWTMVKVYSRAAQRFGDSIAVVDTGCSFIHMPKSIYKSFGYAEANGIPVRIIGINGESRGMSYVVDNFALGDLELGPTRVVVSEIGGVFKDTIILGMNVLVWFHMAINYSTEVIKLFERHPRITPGWSPQERFTMHDIHHRVFNELLASAEVPDERLIGKEYASELSAYFEDSDGFDGSGFSEKYTIVRNGVTYAVSTEVKAL